MPKIITKTTIDAPLQRCFDLARSVDLHQVSTAQTNEYIVKGRRKGLLENGENVTWRAKHFGVWQNLTSRITAFESPIYFCDEMVKGAFRSFKHEHIFETINGKTVMTDVFDFESPFGIIGQVFNKLVLIEYMRAFLEERNLVIKDFAETDKWRKVINQ